MADERNKNNFKRLMEEEYEPRFTIPQMTEIERRIKRKHDSYRVTGDVLDLFFPKIIKTVIGMLGGDDEPSRPAPSDFGRGGPPPSGPKAPGGR
jgi:hypothetical protein